jgi:hypothetical protein
MSTSPMNVLGCLLASLQPPVASLLLSGAGCTLLILTKIHCIHILPEVGGPLTSSANH